MNRKKQLFINLISSGFAFIIQMGISFILTPYITKTIGVEAYGFISLGNNFINYASLITIALNSMAGRFITIELHRKNIEGANKYFTSVFIANVIISILMVIPSIIFIGNIENFINISPNLIFDVKILFVFLLLNYLVSIVFSVYSVSTFAVNKLYLSSLRKIESYFMKAVILVVLFFFYNPTVFFVSFATFTVQLYLTIFNVHYTRKYLQSIKLSKIFFDLGSLKEVMSSGMWNTINRLGQMMSSGFDLLLSNLFINPAAMGTLSVAKVLPNAILLLVGMLSSVFMPDFTILYAKNLVDDLLISIRRSIKILGIIIVIPISILISLGDVFFALWIPGQDSKMLQLLAIITISPIIVSGPINSLYNVFSVTNKLRVNALTLLLTGGLNIIIVILLLKNTNFGVFAIAGVSGILDITRNIVITVPLSAKYLGLKWTAFYKDIIRPVETLIIITIIGLFLKNMIYIDGWLSFFVISAIIAILGLSVSALVILNKSERLYLKGMLTRVLK